MTTLTTEHRLLTTKQLAEHLSVHPKTLTRWRKTCTPPLPCVRLRSRVRYDLRDVLEWLATSERRTEG